MQLKRDMFIHTHTLPGCSRCVLVELVDSGGCAQPGWPDVTDIDASGHTSWGGRQATSWGIQCTTSRRIDLRVRTYRVTKSGHCLLADVPDYIFFSWGGGEEEW